MLPKKSSFLRKRNYSLKLPEFREFFSHFPETWRSRLISGDSRKFSETWQLCNDDGKHPDPPEYRHVSGPEEGVKGEELSRKHWTTLNRLRTGVGRYRASMKKWGLADSAACECGEPEQTADHIINSCPLHRPPSEAGLSEVGPLTRAWLQQTELNI